MAREKTTVTLDRRERVLRTERLRREVAIYAARPASDDELALAETPVAFDLGDDDVDCDARHRDRVRLTAR